MQTTPPSANEYLPFAIQWTRDDCAALEQAGLLTFHYELINGVIIKTMGQNLRHTSSVTNAMAWLIGAFGRNFVQTQASIYVAEADNTINKPEPDVALLNRPFSAITTEQALPSDIRFIIEIADTTRDFDLGTKAALYARAGIPEYWVLSLAERQLYVHLLGTDSTYNRASFSESERVAIQSAPQSWVLVSDLLPAT